MGHQWSGSNGCDGLKYPRWVSAFSLIGLVYEIMVIKIPTHFTLLAATAMLLSCAQTTVTSGVNTSQTGCDSASLTIRGPAMSFILDDGGKRDISLFLPVFKRLGVVVSSALNSRAIGDGSHLSADDVRSLAAAGWEIENHSATHPDLTVSGDLSTEVVQSKLELQKLNVPVSKVFTYPFGRWNSAVVAALCKNYDYGVAVNNTINSGQVNPWNLSRIGLDPGLASTEIDQRLQQTLEAKGWLIWLVHSYAWDAGASLSEVEYAVKAARARGVKIVLPSEFLSSLMPKQSP